MNDELNQENLNKSNEEVSSAAPQETQQTNFTMNQNPQYGAAVNQQAPQFNQAEVNQATTEQQTAQYNQAAGQQALQYNQSTASQQAVQYNQSTVNQQAPQFGQNTNNAVPLMDYTNQNARFVNDISMNLDKKAEKKAAKANKKAAKAAKLAEKKKTGNGKRFLKKSIALVSAAAVFGVIAGAGFQGVSYLANRENRSSQGSAVLQAVDEFSSSITNADNNSSTQNGTVESTTNSSSAIVATDVSGVVANVMPSIVAINCTATMTEYDFFGRQYENEVSGSGSGIIIGQSDDELLVATNNHVVEGAKALEIVFADDTKALATVKGTEPNSDLAVVSVKMSDIKKDTLGKIRIATLGDSSKVKPGEMVIAIGNALGYGQSVTVGYISALDREVTTETTKMNLLQTDAAINPGNSGGALINTHGEIIGINSVKYARTDVEGVGYAIPITTAIPIFNELMNREDLTEEEMGYIGITGKNIEESFANAFNMPVGISIDKVSKDSPAEAAGLKKGEIIVGINDKKIETMQDLQNTLSYTRAGTKVTLNLKVLEDGKYVDKDVEVTLGKRESK